MDWELARRKNRTWENSYLRQLVPSTTGIQENSDPEMFVWRGCDFFPHDPSMSNIWDMTLKNGLTHGHMWHLLLLPLLPIRMCACTLVPEVTCHITVETLYNTINFCWSTHKRHSIARPKGRGMGCLLWVQRATYCVDLSLLSSMKYLL